MNQDFFELIQYLDEKFTGVDKKFNDIDKRFDKLFNVFATKVEKLGMKLDINRLKKVVREKLGVDVI